MPPDSKLIREALQTLGIDRLVLSIHDQSFPSWESEDTGRGTPYSSGALDLAGFARNLGFTAIQLGPQGKTSRTNPSPYDSTIFTRSLLSLAPGALINDDAFECVLKQEDIDYILQEYGSNSTSKANRIDYESSYDIADAMLRRAYSRFRSTIFPRKTALVHNYQRFLENRLAHSPCWFERDCLFEALSEKFKTDDWRCWQTNDGVYKRLYISEGYNPKLVEKLSKENAETIDRFAFGQFLLSLQHESLRRSLRSQDMSLYGDMQVGFSHQDRWAWQSLFLPNYLLGAPPSRSNPEGQPWGYPVLNPAMYFENEKEGPALRLVRARVERMLEDYDGIRIDHPHGLVCPWVYRNDVPNPFHAVRNGARLNCTPNLEGHVDLSKFSIVSKEQLCRESSMPRHADDYVKNLSEDQVNRFAVIIDCILGCAGAHGRKNRDIICEVLSTWPAPLKEVMTRRGLGRFCITQKADSSNPADVYRGENTGPHDWIMVGTHDTQPLWKVVEQRGKTSWIKERASLLSYHLEPDSSLREEFALRCSNNKALFCQAMFAELFASPARNVSVFFADLFGMKETYNSPGTTGDHNWTLRLASDYRNDYQKKVKQGRALDMHAALALALEAKGQNLTGKDKSLAAALRANSVLNEL
jgi:4-alpha-glucanotransferase